MKRLSGEQKREAQENLELAFQHLKETVEQPEKVAHIPEESILIPMKVQGKTK